jgi:hypothetical protein
MSVRNLSFGLQAADFLMLAVLLMVYMFPT